MSTGSNLACSSGSLSPVQNSEPLRRHRLRVFICAVQKLEDAKREARRRGEQKTQTSDAKFDEKFQVGHGLSGEANKPWYAKSGTMLQSEEAAPLQVHLQLETQLDGAKQKCSCACTCTAGSHIRMCISSALSLLLCAARYFRHLELL